MDGLKESFKVYDKPIDFNETKYNYGFRTYTANHLEEINTAEFWCNIKEYPQLSEKALKMLFPFPPIYLV